MRPPTSATTRTLRAELLHLLYSRTLLVVCLLMAAGTVAAFAGSLGAARSAHEFFLQRVQTFQSHGVSLEDALAAPMTVTTDARGETIDNPLKYDYLQVGTAVHAVDGVVPFVGTALDLVTFIVLPIVMIAAGLHAATTDRRLGTLGLRAARDRWADLVAAKLLALAALGVGATIATAAVAAVVAVGGSPLVHDVTGDIAYGLVEPESTSPLAAKLVSTALVGVFFGLVGYATGSVTGSSSWPLAAFALVLFLLPFASPWDPRNLLAVLGSGVYDFWGQFRMRPPLPVELPTAAAVLAAYAVLVLALSIAFPRRGRRFH